MIGLVNNDNIHKTIPQDDDTRSAQQSEQGHNKEQGAASTERPVHVTKVTVQSSGNETDHSTTHSSRNEGTLKFIFNLFKFCMFIVTPTNILYTGRMYHEKKEVGHWITIYSVVRDLEVLKQVGDNKILF